MNAVDIYRLGVGVAQKSELEAAAAGLLYGTENAASTGAAKSASATTSQTAATMEWLHRHSGNTEDASQRNYDVINLSKEALPIFPYTEWKAVVDGGSSQVHIP